MNNYSPPSTGQTPISQSTVYSGQIPRRISDSQNPFIPPAPPGTASTPSPKRRRLHLNPPLHAADPSSIVVADMQNESDALHILALASGQAESRDEGDVQRSRSQSKGPDASRNVSGHITQKSKRKTAKLADFALIKLGIIDESQTATLTEKFFRFHHHLFVSWQLSTPR